MSEVIGKDLGCTNTCSIVNDTLMSIEECEQ